MKISWETVTVDESQMGLYVCQPDGAGPFPAVVVIQNQAGVGEFTQEMTQRVAEAGYVGVAPELYHREGPTLTEAEIASRKNTRRDAAVIKDVNAAVDFLRSCSFVDAGKLGIVGFCMGGRVSFMMAAANPAFGAAVDYYGGGKYTAWGDGPTPASRAGELHCPLQGHFGELDKNPSPAEMRRLDLELSRLGKPHEFYFYDGAPHGFNRKGWNGYKPEADAVSWSRTLNFFGAHLLGAEQKRLRVSP
jgi:carboxymethylenebutenolidase